MKIADANKRGYIVIIILMGLSFLFTGMGCGGGDSSSSASVNDGDGPGGSIAFRVQWQDPDKNPNARVAGIDCEGAGVFDVTAEVYGFSTPHSETGEPDSPSFTDGVETLLASGGPWTCSAHSATIDSIPPGEERWVVIRGLDSEGITIYRGEAYGLTVEAGRVTDAGLIEAFPVNGTIPQAPTGVSATPGDGQVSLTWNPTTGAATYRVSKGEAPGLYDTTVETSTDSYLFTDLVNGSTYYFIVTAVNSFGESPASVEVSATPGAATPDTFVNTFGMTFVRIPAGTFTMGSTADELGRDADETPHQVTLTQDFYMMTTEVTQGQWLAVMGENPSFFANCGDNCPVDSVSWEDAQIFISTLISLEDRLYRLPTEAEWEYAARAGSSTAFANGGITHLDCSPVDANLDAMGWYCGNSADTTHPFSQKQANAWGVFDMHGNVWEWCLDWYGEYPTVAVTDPTGPTSGSTRVVRGGSWGGGAQFCRSASRKGDDPLVQFDGNGFRLVLSIAR